MCQVEAINLIQWRYVNEKCLRAAILYYYATHSKLYDIELNNTLSLPLYILSLFTANRMKRNFPSLSVSFQVLFLSLSSSYSQNSSVNTHRKTLRKKS